MLILTPSKLTVMVKVPATTDATPVVTKYPPRLLFEMPRENLLALNAEGFRQDMHAAQRWIGIPGAWPKTTDHLIVIEFRLEDGGSGEMLLRVNKCDAEEIAAELRKGLPERAGPQAPDQSGQPSFGNPGTIRSAFL